jgi:deoxyribodipyrimidine photo-lyase
MSQDQSKITLFWFRRDLRLQDNTALYFALSGDVPVLPLFIFDRDILDRLEDKQDRRVEFIHLTLEEIQDELQKTGSSLLIRSGTQLQVWKNLLEEYDIAAVYTNHDYEPCATQRDKAVEKLLTSRGIEFHTCKDQVIFEKNDILTAEEKPYTVFFPYRNKWRKTLRTKDIQPNPSEVLTGNFLKTAPFPFPSLTEIGFLPAGANFPPRTLREEIIRYYHKQRDYPALEG